MSKPLVVVSRGIPSDVLLLNIAGGYVPNAILGESLITRTPMMQSGYGRTLKQARSEAQAFMALALAQEAAFEAVQQELEAMQEAGSY